MNEQQQQNRAEQQQKNSTHECSERKKVDLAR